MNDLPNELLVAIFKRLPLTDRNSCRCVSKRFKTWVDAIRLTDLVLSNATSRDDFAVCWYGTFDRVNLQNSVSTLNLKLFTSIMFPSFVYKEVRRLRMFAQENFKVNDDFVDALNRFKELEQLELGKLVIKDPRYEMIRLPNLRTLRIEDAWMERDSNFLYVKLPKIETLYAGSSALVVIDGLPVTVKYLEVDVLNDCNQLKDLKVLEIVKCNFTRLVRKNAVSYLLNLRTMTELHFAFDGQNKEECDEARSIFNHALQHLGKSNCKLFFNGVLVLNTRSFEEYGFAAKDLLSLHIENPRLLTESCTQLRELDYERVAIDKIPNGFLRRYPNVRKISVNGPTDSTELWWFLKDFRNLTHLVLKNTALSSEFLEQVPTLNCSLYRFEFYEKTNNTPIDFEFTYRLDHLQQFQTDQQLPVQMVSDLFLRLDHFTTCGFRSSEMTIGIRKVDRFRYTLAYKMGEIQSTRKSLCHRQLVGLLDYFAEKKQ